MVALLDDNRIDLTQFMHPVRAAVLCMGSAQVAYSMRILAELRNAGIVAVPYLDANKKFKNQIEFADKIGADYSIIIGDAERESEMLAVKNMKTGEQQTITLTDTIKLLK